MMKEVKEVARQKIGEYLKSSKKKIYNPVVSCKVPQASGGRNPPSKKLLLNI